LIAIVILLSTANFASAGDELDIYFFWGDGCPHCAKEEIYLDKLEQQYPQIRVHDFEIYNNRSNALLLQKVGRELGARVEGIPFTIIGDKSFVGFSESSSPAELGDRVAFCLEQTCPNVTAGIVGLDKEDEATFDQEISGDDVQTAANVTEEGGQEKKEMDIPFLGRVDLNSFSLPVLTVIMGALDGFNPCAMWTLLFLIGLLLGMQNRKRMWILGIAFIVASASVYFVFMAAWLNLILFLGFVLWVRILIGLVALLGGAYSLKEFFVRKDDSCKVVSGEKRQRVFGRLRAITQLPSFWLALGGIIILAFAVNLVELICSAGLPAVYTQILALSDLTKWQHYSYIALYIFIFMLDDLFVFFAAMITLRVTGVTTKYTRASRLIGGLLMLAIGLLLIFWPQVLMFG